jgi:hypothetical protein
LLTFFNPSSLTDFDALLDALLDTFLDAFLFVSVK